MERLKDEDLAKLGITKDMLIDAVEELGGAVNMRRHYPLSEPIRQRLAEVL